MITYTCTIRHWASAANRLQVVDIKIFGPTIVNKNSERTNLVAVVIITNVVSFHWERPFIGMTSFHPNWIVGSAMIWLRFGSWHHVSCRTVKPVISSSKIMIANCFRSLFPLITSTAVGITYKFVVNTRVLCRTACKKTCKNNAKTLSYTYNHVWCSRLLNPVWIWTYFLLGFIEGMRK